MTRSRGPAPRTPTQRQRRVGELVRHALADILSRGDVHDPELESATITISEVRMSPDLKIATGYVMPLGGHNAEAAVAALNRASKFLRGAVARRIVVRHAPELRFHVDDSFAEGERIDALLRSPVVKADTGKVD